MSVDEDYFIPVRNGVGSDITSLAGGTYTGDIDDVKYLRDKLFAALKVPQSYLSRGEGGEEDKAALAQKDIRFARTIQRLQRSIVSELEKVGIIHLYTLGYKSNDLISFKLFLNNPSRIAELQELEHWRTKFEIAGSATEGFFSKRWVSQNVFNLSEEEIIRNQREMYFDKIFASQLEKAPEEEAAGAPAPGLEAGGTDLGAEEAGGEMDLGGEEEAGDELDLGGEETGGEEAGGAEGGEMLLATPGKRDDEEWYKLKKGKSTTTSKSKGKWYTPVEFDKRKNLAPKKKSMKKQYGDRLASPSRENITPSLNTFLRYGKGIYENKDSNYSLEENNILGANEEIQRIISQLEKREHENK